MPLLRKFMNFSSQNDVVWCIMGVLFLRFMCPMDCSCMINFILGGRQHRTTPAGQLLGGRDPFNPCGVDAYANEVINRMQSMECRLLLQTSWRTVVCMLGTSMSHANMAEPIEMPFVVGE